MLVVDGLSVNRKLIGDFDSTLLRGSVERLLKIRCIQESINST